MVERIDDRGVTVGGKLIPCGAVLWTAGVSPSPLVKMLGVPTDRAGRACVSPFLNVPDAPGVFVVGDTATLMQDGKPLPGVAQVAIQQGRYVGRVISRELSGRKPPRPFRYFDKGNMAVVGKNFAIMESGRIKLAGLTPWLIWAFIHILFLPQLQNRLRVQNQWLWTYFTGPAQLTSGLRGAAIQQVASSNSSRIATIEQVHWTSKSMTEQRTLANTAAEPANGKKIAVTPSACVYPLLIKQLLHTPLAQAAHQEIVYRDVRRFTYLELRDRIGRLASALHQNRRPTG